MHVVIRRACGTADYIGEIYALAPNGDGPLTTTAYRKRRQLAELLDRGR